MIRYIISTPLAATRFAVVFIVTFFLLLFPVSATTDTEGKANTASETPEAAFSPVAAVQDANGPAAIENHVRALAAFGDRSTGSPGAEAARAYIGAQFKKLGLAPERQLFRTPVRRHDKSELSLPGGVTESIAPLIANAISPGTIPPEGISGPLVYAGNGKPEAFNGRSLSGSVILMDIDSEKNWLHAANFGARALIYICDEGEGDTPSYTTMTQGYFEDKFELSPIDFPRFVISRERARALFGDYEAPDADLPREVRLTSDMRWQNVAGENLYALIPGADPELSKQLLVIESFYDSMVYVAGRSPGADQAVGVATLLETARHLVENPPARSVLLLATAGHAQSLAGMREAIWSISTKSDEIKALRSEMKARRDAAEKHMETLEGLIPAAMANHPDTASVREALRERIKTEIDAVSRRLMQLRLQGGAERDEAEIRRLAKERLTLRGLRQRNGYQALSPAETEALERFIPLAHKDFKGIAKDARALVDEIKSAKAFRDAVKEYDIAGIVSLHLSSHGDGIGGFNDGWLYGLRGRVNRVSVYSPLSRILTEIAESTDVPPAVTIWDSLRPGTLRSWESYLPDRPQLGGEVSALASHLGLTLATVHDTRARWGTPGDLPDRVDFEFAGRQSETVRRIIDRLAAEPESYRGKGKLRKGFASVTGRGRRIRHGELFADQTAPDAMVLAFQGDAYYHVMADASGDFHLKGVATKKMVPDKVIFEAYRFDAETGGVVWAVDKRETGKDAYRLKMDKREMETDLIFFNARQMTLFKLLEPRSFSYMTRLQLLDGRREAEPRRYWYSRIDTRQSTITSVYLEPGSYLKLTHSDTVLRRKMVLTNGKPDNPQGTGYRIDDHPRLTRTAFRVASDMWRLLDPRIGNLERHGIRNERIRTLRERGLEALNDAKTAWAAQRYDRFNEASQRSWALASRVYNHVDETQKDVLLGVLFYIALFVPFAFCAEQLIFGFRNIHKRIVAFFGILLALITIIYQVHPAFHLAYSPGVVILAFFIMGLSLVVTLILFFRFEQEMTLLQRRATEMRAEEVSRWKAFTAAFFLGVGNLRRRPVRTALTCTTLVILTFTIMSFTTVKTARRHTRLLYRDHSPYQGYLLKTINWNDLPPESFDTIAQSFGPDAVTAPRAWMEDLERTRPLFVPLRSDGGDFSAQAVVGLSADEPRVSGIDKVLTAGRWFGPDENNAVLLADRIAEALNLPEPTPETAPAIRIWGEAYRVVGLFSGKRLDAATDLDGETITPVTFPTEVVAEPSEAELEAMASGEDVRAFQGHYRHVPSDMAIILPYRRVMALGGHLKSVAVRPSPDTDISEKAKFLADRFALTLFSGEPAGTYMYTASDTLNYSGMPNVVIPMVISVLIVLNTMIGSVYERKREIQVYTSVGLAPSHVSFLFVAEALAFAVLSVVLGYLFAQVSAGLFAGTALWSGITVNYSSLAGVMAMVLVMLVVLISAIYPSRLAAEIAIPDVNRSWSLPDINDNSLEIVLPFLIKHHEHDSIAGFLISWFEGHKDISHGIFSTGGVDAERLPLHPSGSGPTCIFMRVHMWLAPFDFGIRQNAMIRFCESEENADFLEIVIRLVRESGEANAWKRVNKAFLNHLRKQLLIWRSLSDAEKHEYAPPPLKSYDEERVAA